MKIIERDLTTDKDGVPGYLPYPERQGRGPALLLVHQNTGVTDYIKIEALKFAQLGYTTIIPNLYEMADGPSPTHIHTRPSIQARTSDACFVNSLTKGWQFLLSGPDVDGGRVGVIGYCMGGRLAIHFVAATPQVRAFAGYYPTVRDNPTTELRPVHPWQDVKKFRCPSIILYGRNDMVTAVPVQDKGWKAFRENGQSLEWHFFPFGGHGFVDPGTAGYHPHTAYLAWPLVVDFLARELSI